jgi:hypothetical protein
MKIQFSHTNRISNKPIKQINQLIIIQNNITVQEQI